MSGGFNLFEVDTRSTPAFDGGKAAGQKALAALSGQNSELQERLYAESKSGGRRSVLLVVQGMDTSGKGGIMRHVVGEMDPQGVSNTAFKAPSAEERNTPSCGGSARRCPRPGQIGVFDRSHYEDVLIVRVHELVPRSTWSRRYAQINAFERSVVGVRHDGRQGHAAHLRRTSRRPGSWSGWTGPTRTGSSTRATSTSGSLWPRYLEAYQTALEKCSTPEAPWFVVPADRKWYARLAVSNLAARAPARRWTRVAGRRLRRRGGEGAASPPREPARPSSGRLRRRLPCSQGEGPLDDRLRPTCDERTVEGAERDPVASAEPARDERVGDGGGGVPDEQARPAGSGRAARRGVARRTARPGRAAYARPTSRVGDGGVERSALCRGASRSSLPSASREAGSRVEGAQRRRGR